MAARLALALSLALAAQPGGAVQKAPTRLFASDQPIRIALQGPISAIARSAASSTAAQPARLTLLSPASEAHAVLLSARGLARRDTESCEFPPLRVQFTARPVATSLFERQRRLKLVTHCRASAGFQQHVLLEYAAYRMFNLLSPASFRVRLASIDYVQDNGRPLVSRLGFFIEDPDDAARRIGLKQVEVMTRAPPAQLDPAATARAALFQYMIGNVDFSFHAGPAGDTCCHNAKLFGRTAAVEPGLVPVPYDFDISGFVDAPYAAVPEKLALSSVRERRYRGYCSHNAQALVAAAEFRAQRVQLLAVLTQVPQLEEAKRRSAAAYLDSFFRDIATNEDVNRRVLRNCIR